MAKLWTTQRLRVLSHATEATEKPVTEKRRKFSVYEFSIKTIIQKIKTITGHLTIIHDCSMLLSFALVYKELNCVQVMLNE